MIIPLDVHVRPQPKRAAPITAIARRTAAKTLYPNAFFHLILYLAVPFFPNKLKAGALLY